MRYNYIQHGFTSGELSPRMEMREDLKSRAYGVEIMENFFPHLQGSTETLPGFEYLNSISEDYGRLFSFRIDDCLERTILITTTRICIVGTNDQMVQEILHDKWDTHLKLDSIQVAFPSQEVSMYIVSSYVFPQILKYDRSSDSFSLSPAQIVSPPDEWGSNNYPGAITFYGGRLYYGGTGLQPSQIWGSKSVAKASDVRNYDNFTIGSLADDAISFSIPKAGKIMWMQGTKDFLVGTDTAEAKISSEGGVIIPGDIQVKIQSTIGSCPHQPIVINNELFFISADRRRIYKSRYDWMSDNWKPTNILFGADHLTRQQKLKRIVSVKNPDNLIFCTTEEGHLIGALYDSESEVVGFFRKQSNSTCVFKDVISIERDGSSELWGLIDRDINSKLYIERINFQKGNVKLDSYLILFNTSGNTDTFTAPTLKGQECQVILDGKIQGSVIPDANTGEFTLPEKGLICVIGLPILSRLITLPLAGDISTIGTIRTLKKRWIRLFVRIYSSFKPKINGIRPPARSTSTPMDTMESAKTENVKVSNLGWDREGRILIEQDLPLFTEILGIFGEVSQRGYE